METIYHPGELKVQALADLQEETARLGRTIPGFAEGVPLAAPETGKFHTRDDTPIPIAMQSPEEAP